MPRGYLNFAEVALCSSGSEAILNVYTEHESSIDTCRGKVSVNVSGSYLKDGRVSVRISSESDGIINLRIPAWSKTAKIVARGKSYAANGGEYFKLEIPAGVSDIEISFHMEAVICEFKDHSPSKDRLEYAKGRFAHGYMDDSEVTEDEMVWDRRATLTYGPLLLTKSRKCGNTTEEIFTKKTVAFGGYKATVTPLEENGTRVKFNVNFDNGKDSFDVVMCDYATGSNEHYTTDCRLFSIFV
jgi:hypothetical protein